MDYDKNDKNINFKGKFPKLINPQFISQRRSYSTKIIGNSKPIIVLDSYRNEIARYPSNADAIRDLNLNKKLLQQVLITGELYLDKYFIYDIERPLDIYPKDIKWNDLTQDIRDYIIGGTLGDLSIVKKTDNSTPYLNFHVSTKNITYLEYLFDLFKFKCNMPKISIKENKIKNKIYYTGGFSTLSYKFLNEIYDLFYVNKIKVIPYNIGDYLTPRALAFWYQDDGNCNYTEIGNISTFSLATHCFTFADMHYLSYVLKLKYNLIVNVHNDKGQPILYITASSRELFLDLITPFVHENFKYKISNRDPNHVITNKGTGISINVINLELPKTHPYYSIIYPSIRDVARNLKIDRSTIIHRLFSGMPYNDKYLFYTNEIAPLIIKDSSNKGKKVYIYNKNLELIEILSSQRQVVRKYNIPKTTLTDYLKNGKFWNNSFYFSSLNLSTYKNAPTI
uniref:Orf451 n=1 Tax=Rhizophydium sp. 136 TaxID=60187 RepID=Q950L4_9FUNG|nr:orf451 [Rhizophydium sp. 136]AAK84294.1 orf451 [Rhizophydium sp. 136]